jgi:hypothetical protein
MRRFLAEVFDEDIRDMAVCVLQTIVAIAICLLPFALIGGLVWLFG